jgi:hypothetical protein
MESKMKIYKKRVSEDMWHLFNKPARNKKKDTIAVMCKGVFAGSCGYYWVSTGVFGEAIGCDATYPTQRKCLDNLSKYIEGLRHDA